MSRPWITAALIVYGVVAAVAMIVLGWPESTPAQVAMLELAALPLQAALGLGVWRLSRRMRPPGGRGRRALQLAAGLGGIGLALVGLAYLTGPRAMVHLGLALVWLGLLVALLVVVTHLPRRPMPADTFTAIGDDDEAPEDAPDDVASGAGSAEPRPPAAVARGEAGSIESGRD